MTDFFRRSFFTSQTIFPTIVFTEQRILLKKQVLLNERFYLTSDFTERTILMENNFNEQALTEKTNEIDEN